VRFMVRRGDRCFGARHGIWGYDVIVSAKALDGGILMVSKGSASDFI
jgi:hypothetical protein